MAKRKAVTILKSAKVFVNENDEAIEKEVYKNADIIIDESKNKKEYLDQAHEAIIDALDLKSVHDSKYFDFETFKGMVHEQTEKRMERKKKAEEKRKKELEKQEQEQEHSSLEEQEQEEVSEYDFDEND